MVLRAGFVLSLNFEFLNLCIIFTATNYELTWQKEGPIWSTDCDGRSPKGGVCKAPRGAAPGGLAAPGSTAPGVLATQKSRLDSGQLSKLLHPGCTSRVSAILTIQSVSVFVFNSPAHPNLQSGQKTGVGSVLNEGVEQSQWLWRNKLQQASWGQIVFRFYLKCKGKL